MKWGKKNNPLSLYIASFQFGGHGNSVEWFVLSALPSVGDGEEKYIPFGQLIMRLLDYTAYIMNLGHQHCFIETTA